MTEGYALRQVHAHRTLCVFAQALYANGLRLGGGVLRCAARPIAGWHEKKVAERPESPGKSRWDGLAGDRDRGRLDALANARLGHREEAEEALGGLLGAVDLEGAGGRGLLG